MTVSVTYLTQENDIDYIRLDKQYTLSEAIGSLDRRCNSSVGSMLIKQLAEAQLLTSSETADLDVSSIYWAGYHLSQLLQDSEPR